ncbi:transmembrane protein KIAA1109-like [Branchiostoma floridae]|uniref:Transmembrane protein KIAA1109-like n=1 Tax=Branchiostoma floridae TaxID=7739 RepID=A0A9J7MXU1_BRAFL|nr:transmembrane protein KIAA1109-like [Branchiostoma floridae]
MALFLGLTVAQGSESQYSHSNLNGSLLNPDNINDDLRKVNSNIIWLLAAAVLACGWVLYLTYYNSRVLGFILTRILNRFVKNCHINVGSFSVSVLSGKVMFRDVHYIDYDRSIRVQDGVAIFRWWRPYIPRESKYDPTPMDTRLNLYLNGFEYHIYNRSDIYGKLEKAFGLDQTMGFEYDPPDDGKQGDRGSETPENTEEEPEKEPIWRDLIPFIKADIYTGRIVFGNRLIPSTLCVNWEEAKLEYTTKCAHNPLDKYTHFIKAETENVRVMLSKSPKYEGDMEEPPRFMGEGFVVLQSGDVIVYYYWDEPGRMKDEIPESTNPFDIDIPPVWRMDIKCGKGTDISYGPWVDKQREFLQKFFLPADYQSLEVTEPVTTGQLRQYTSFDMSMHLQNDATIDILFSKKKETNAIHMNVGRGSCIEMTIPYVVEEGGYCTKVTSRLLHLDATTSLEYRSLLEAETLEISMDVHYPIVWNHPQLWSCDIVACKTTVNFIFAHKFFIMDLIDDWGSKTVPDIMGFVPYTWKFNVALKEFEFILVTNQYNWIDCSSLKDNENGNMAIGGERVDISFDLPFTDFLPETVCINFLIQGKSLDARLFLPEMDTTRHCLLSLVKNSRYTTTAQDTADCDKGWRNITHLGAGWVDTWHVPAMSMCLGYTYHPIMPEESKGHLLPRTVKSKVSDIEEEMLSSLRPTPQGTPEVSAKRKVRLSPSIADLDLSSISPDRIDVEVDVGPSVITLYATFLRMFFNFKENYFGADMKFTDLARPGRDPDKVQEEGTTQLEELLASLVTLRPLAVTVQIAVNDVTARIPRQCSPRDPPCPTLHFDKLCFEMRKNYYETLLQLHISPITASITDNIKRPMSEAHLKDGQLHLSGLQMRGHAMFSDKDRPLGSDTLEYAWLVQLQLGEISGKITPPHIETIVDVLETALFLFDASESDFMRPLPYEFCQHDNPQPSCPHKDDYPFPCPTEFLVKYKMLTLEVQKVDLFVVESGCACQLQTSSLHISNCNLHSPKVKEGITVAIPELQLHQYITQTSPSTFNHSAPPPGRLGGASPTPQPLWLEAGSFSLGPIHTEVALAIECLELQQAQDDFLRNHDKKYQRLWFLWSPEEMGLTRDVISKCGCHGGCIFFISWQEPITQENREAFRHQAPKYGESLFEPGIPALCRNSRWRASYRDFDLRLDSSKSGRRSEDTLSTTKELNSSSETVKATPSTRISTCTSSSTTTTLKGGSVSEPGTPVDDQYPLLLHHQADVVSPVSPQETDPLLIQPITRGRLGSDKSQVTTATDKSSSQTSVHFASEHSYIADNTSSLPRSVQRAGSKQSVQSDQPLYRSQHTLTSGSSMVSVESFYSADEELGSATSEEVFSGRDIRQLHAATRSVKSTPTLHQRSISVASNQSFLSAVSTQEDLVDFDISEDVSVVNMPITADGDLMALYAKHLTQCEAMNWNPAQAATKPAVVEEDFGMRRTNRLKTSWSEGPPTIPIFNTLNSGISSTTVVYKDEVEGLQGGESCDQSFDKSRQESYEEDCPATGTGDTLEDHVSKTGAIVKVKGSINILLSPLALEATERLVEAATPQLQTMHASVLVDKLHSKCLREVQCQNRLSAEGRAAENGNGDEGSGIPTSKTSSLQILVSVARINISILQASVAGAKSDLYLQGPCASLAVLSLDSITCQLLHYSQSLKAGDDEDIPPDKEVPEKKKRKKDKYSSQVGSDGVDSMRVREIQKEEGAAYIHLDRIHGQLRCLSPSNTEVCTFTAIPPDKSKVMFLVQPGIQSVRTSHESLAEEARDTLHQETCSPMVAIQGGWIMFECGLEDITIRGGRRIGFEEAENGPDFPGKSASSTVPPGEQTTDSTETIDSTKTVCNSDSFSSHRWRSLDEIENGQEENVAELKGDASNAVVSLSNVWLNFASPSSAAQHRQTEDISTLDYTLLTTVAPTICAWLSPADQLKQALHDLAHGYRHRTFAVIGCIMTDALEFQGLHMSPKSTAIEDAVKTSSIPPLSTLEKGLVALTRQWKHLVITSAFAGMGFTNRRRLAPFTVTFLEPETRDEVFSEGKDGEQGEGFPETDYDASEHTFLLGADAKAGISGIDNLSGVGNSTGLPMDKKHSQMSLADTYKSGDSASDIKSRDANRQAVPLVATLSSTGSLRRNRNESQVSHVMGSVDSLDASGPNTPQRKLKGSFSRASGASIIPRLTLDKEFNLYSWMSASLAATRSTSVPMHDVEMGGFSTAGPGTISNQPSGYQSLASDNHSELSGVTSNPSLSPKHMANTVQLADPQVIFQPLLSSLGIDTQKQSAMPDVSKLLSKNVALTGKLQSLRVDIVDADSAGFAAWKPKGKPKTEKKFTRFLLDMKPQHPALLFEEFIVESSIRDVSGKKSDSHQTSTENEGTTGNQGRRRSTVASIEFNKDNVNCVEVFFSAHCEGITQHVDMALLQLAKQFYAMTEHIKQTETELKVNRYMVSAATAVNRPGHKKQDSHGSDLSGQSGESQSQPSTSKQSESGSQAGADTLLQPPKTPVRTDSQRSTASEGKVSIEPKRSFSHRSRLPSLKGSRSSLKKRLASPRIVKSLRYHRQFSQESAAISINEETSISSSEQSETLAKCWQTMYHLIDLYSNVSEGLQLSHVKDKAEDIRINIEDNLTSSGQQSSVPETPRAAPASPTAEDKLNRLLTISSVGSDHPPIHLVGTVGVTKMRLLAEFAGLNLEAEMTGMQASVGHREKMKVSVEHDLNNSRIVASGLIMSPGAYRLSTQRKHVVETSITAHVQKTELAILEGLYPAMHCANYATTVPLLHALCHSIAPWRGKRTVVSVKINRSQCMYTSSNRKSKERNLGVLNVGMIDVDIPQHPVALHGTVTRSSKQLSSQISELTRQPKARSTDSSSNLESMSQPSPQQLLPPLTEIDNLPPGAKQPAKKPFLLNFKIVMDGLAIGASLLPSLKAEYKISRMLSSGMTGDQARFTIDLPMHTLGFASKVVHQEYNLPSSASVDLPPIHVSGSYKTKTIQVPNTVAPGMVSVCTGYLLTQAEVGSFEHMLTTDLLNHLLFVQKVFMKEVNDVVQKVSRGERPVAPWMDRIQSSDSYKPTQVLYSLKFRLKGIQVTATTPTSNAVRLETGIVELELSNMVEVGEGNGQLKKSGSHLKLFGKAHVDLNLALGQLVGNQIFEEAEPEFHQMAYFKTRIGLRNALQDEMSTSRGMAEDKTAVLITLTRPIFYVQPAAFDKAVLVWLNYKNAYEYWNEQRMALNQEVQAATSTLIDILPQISPQGPPTLGTLFLQLTVNDLGICLPVNNAGTQASTTLDYDPGAALVLTLESSLITACSRDALVCSGHVKGFCLRFADDFETSWDEWKADPTEGIIMNAFTVPEGTYEVCSKTVGLQTVGGSNSGKWVLDILWKMCGLDIQLDTNIGKCLSALGNTLTAIAGEEEGMEDQDVELPEEAEQAEAGMDQLARRPSSLAVPLAGSASEAENGYRRRFRFMEQQMNEQARIVKDLKQLGASQDTIAQEAQRLKELEAAVFYDFRRDVREKLRRTSVRHATSLKDKWGLGYKPSHRRTKSHGAVLGAAAKKKPPRDRPRTEAVDGLHGELLVPSTPSTPLNDSVFTSLDSSARKWSSPLSTTIDDPCQLSAYNSEEDLHPEPAYKVPSLPDNLDSSGSSENDEEIDKHYLIETQRRLVMDPSITSLDRGTPPRSNQSPPRSQSPQQGKSLTPQPSVVEQNIEFELDVKVEIDSGKCVLHPQSSNVEDDMNGSSTKPGGKNRKMGMMYQTSALDITPASSKKHLLKGQVSGNLASGNKSRLGHAGSEVTIFYLPAVDVKAHYNSKTHRQDSPGAGNSKEDVPQQETADGKKKVPTGMKRASLYAMLALQSLPQETVVSPCLLDFLEQTLDVLPASPTDPRLADMTASARTAMDSMFPLDLDTSSTSLGTSYGSPYTSFPVDVIVCVRVQPSIIRFNCLPLSRVECLLQVPLLDLVFSSMTAGFEIREDETDSTTKAQPPLLKRKSSQRHVTFQRPRGWSNLSCNSTDSDHQEASGVGRGGLNFTAGMSDFSLFIFHPYGGQQKKHAGMGTPVEGVTAPDTPLDAGPSATGRKDSLSLNVEFIKVNLSRSKRAAPTTDPGLHASGSMSSGRLRDLMSTPSVQLQQSQDPANVHIDISAVCDVGSASFKYDMRRLNEILAFPRAWYRRSIMRRLFLGDQMATKKAQSQAPTPNQTFSTSPSSVNITSQPAFSTDTPTSAIFPFVPPSPSIFSIKTQSPTAPMKSPVTGPSRRHSAFTAPHGVEDTGRTKRHSVASPPTLERQQSRVEALKADQSPETSSAAGGKTYPAWETVVLFAVKLSRLEVNMNMSNVMGNTVWLTQELCSQGRLCIASTGYKNVSITAGLDSSTLDARGGVVGGIIQISKINTSVNLHENPGDEPTHRCNFEVKSADTRLDYMGAAILMARLHRLTVSLKDEWKVEALTPKAPHIYDEMGEKSAIFIHGDLDWDRFHLMISRSTTPDLIKVCNRLEEFFTQQFNSSRRMLSQWGLHGVYLPQPSSLTPVTPEPAEKPNELADAHHHRHWPSVLARVCGSRLSLFSAALPLHDLVLGGTMNLRGNDLTLACFHGVNFRAKSWALFNVLEPNISFCTEVQEIQEEDGSRSDTYIVQNLSFHIGHNVWVTSEKDQAIPMATIRRLTCGRYDNPPPGVASVHEWFNYVSATRNEELDVFKSPEDLQSNSPPVERRLFSSRKSLDYGHETETIFALPKLQLEFKTEHVQGEKEPQAGDPMPTVVCSFVTEFIDHICVAMDAELILFLHDLVAAYIKEKERAFPSGFRNSTAMNRRSRQDSKGKEGSEATAEIGKAKDWREFQCRVWQLEPTVRLLSWAGKRIDPVGVDYILQKLGFKHARVTIPKWIQRGAMDPIDKILSIFLNKMVNALREEQETSSDAAQ